MKYVALALALFYGVVWLYGGLVYSKLGNAQIYFYLGWLVLLSYLPFYWYRDAGGGSQVRRSGEVATGVRRRAQHADPREVTLNGGGASRPRSPMLWTRTRPSPDPATLTFRRLLPRLGGAPVSSRRGRLRRSSGSPDTGAGARPLHRRVWGTALGFPNPNLYPSKQEWERAAGPGRRSGTYARVAGARSHRRGDSAPEAPLAGSWPWPGGPGATPS